MSEWQPIETAPKDGETVILGARGDCLFFTRWDQDEETWEFLIDSESTYSLLHETHWPRYWMPLPEPPQQKTPASDDRG